VAGKPCSQYVNRRTDTNSWKLDLDSPINVGRSGKQGHRQPFCRTATDTMATGWADIAANCRNNANSHASSTPSGRRRGWDECDNFRIVGKHRIKKDSDAVEGGRRRSGADNCPQRGRKRSEADQRRRVDCGHGAPICRVTNVPKTVANSDQPRITGTTNGTR